MTDKEYNYAWKCFGEATYELATGKGNIKSSLIDASMKIAHLNETYIPPELLVHYNKLMSELSKDGRGWRATIGSMRLNKAQELAKIIVEIEGELGNVCRNQ